MLFLKILLSCLVLSSLSATNPSETPAAISPEATPDRIVIIIDDIGYHKNDLKLVELPYALTYAVLPHTPYGKRSAQLAHQLQKDVMLHMPMEASNGKALGPGGLTRNMSREEVHKQLTSALEDIPYVIGVNNHMGSLYTELEQPMSWIMEYLHQHDLFFVDSLTTSKSKAREQASKHHVVAFSRQVFLDNELNDAALQKQFDQLLQIARQHKTAIGIGHPYPETYQFLQKALPKLTELEIELVGISELLPADFQTTTN